MGSAEEIADLACRSLFRSRLSPLSSSDTESRIRVLVCKIQGNLGVSENSGP